MSVQFDDIASMDWRGSVPNMGGASDDSNLTIIVWESLKCQDAEVLRRAKEKVVTYLSVAKSERLDSIARSLCGVKAEFKDGEAYLPLAQANKIAEIAPKYRVEYAKGKFSFPHLSKEAFSDFINSWHEEGSLSLKSAIEIYLTFESVGYYRQELDYFLLNASNSDKLSSFFLALWHDPWFKRKIERKIEMLDPPDYRKFVSLVNPHKLEWIRYKGSPEVEKLIEMTQGHHSAILIDLKPEHFPLIKGKRRIELWAGQPFTAVDCKILKENNPGLKDLILWNCTPQNGALELVTPSLESLALESCLLYKGDWERLSQSLRSTRLTLKEIRVNQETLVELMPRLSSLTLEHHTYVYFDTPIPFGSLSLTCAAEFELQPHVTALTLDCQTHTKTFSTTLKAFPNLRSFSFSSPYQTTTSINQEFLLALHRSAPNLSRLILNGLHWGEFPPLRTRFLRLTHLDVSRTSFFLSSPDRLLSRLLFIFPRLHTLLYTRTDSLHNEPLIKVLRARFPSLNFVEKKL